MKEPWHVRWFRRRALLYHLIVAILCPGCLLAGWWQINRAMEGNTLSYLYSVEWPIFAIMSVVGWWQLIHEDPAAVESRKVERARRAAHKGPWIPPPADADSGFYHPLQPGHAGAIGTGTAELGHEEVHGLPSGGAEEPVAVHALSSYNAYLAKLSAGGGRKSWRNPHGITAAVVPDGAQPALDDASRPEVTTPAGPSSLPGGTRRPRPLPAGDE